jgi:hypothetical protein
VDSVLRLDLGNVRLLVRADAGLAREGEGVRVVGDTRGGTRGSGGGDGGAREIVVMVMQCVAVGVMGVWAIGGRGRGARRLWLAQAVEVVLGDVGVCLGDLESGGASSGLDLFVRTLDRVVEEGTCERSVCASRGV